MAFIGSVPKQARIVIENIVKTTDKKTPIYVGCSGNFTVDKICADLGWKVFSNDVSLYSKVIADIVMNKDSEVKIKEDFYADLFREWDDHPFKLLAEIMFIMDISEFEKRSNLYQENMYDNFISYNKDFYENTIQKLEKSGSLDFQIENFYFGDFRDHLKDCPGISVLFAPTYTGGYEKMFRRIEEVFEYKHANYKLFESEQAGPVYSDLLKTSQSIIYSDRYFEDLEGFLTSKVLMGEGRKDIYIYCSIDREKKMLLDAGNSSLIKKTYKLLPSDFKFDRKTKIQAVICETKIVNHYKRLFMAAKVNYSEGGDFGLLFFADGLLFGMASITNFLGTKNKRDVFLQSDFCVPHFSKLSKLVAMLLLSKEIQEIVSTKYVYNYLGLQTTVYTKNPVSMKYRGVFEKTERDKKNNKLTYRGSFTNQSLKNIYKKWLQKNS